MSITAYTFMKNLNFPEIKGLAEKIPEGKSTRELIKISKTYKIPILAGLLEIENNRFFNTYICVNNGKVIANFRKVHPFINTYISPGNEYVVFDFFGWKCEILICYNNNIIENARATTLL